jgi:redox-sensitive bicupin YhaK (pirin superfamily)
MSDVITVRPLGFPWQTQDPFLFCAYHHDQYPQGNSVLGPAASLKGRNLGMDFQLRDGWRMYHGEVVPGFPQHPHRGFETVTVVRQGFVDHADSLGATARYGPGDTQWLTAGAGIQHAEMFPLVSAEGPNPLELFQVWLNLPAKSKMAKPHFSMMWAEGTPIVDHKDGAGRTTQVQIVAGTLDGKKALPPPPSSWASQATADVAIWVISMDPGATFTLPPAHPESSRTLYFHRGSTLKVADKALSDHAMVVVKADKPITLVAGDAPCDVFMLQGRPIGEPVAHHGPFVMNTRQELQQAFADYQRTGFGGWPWPSHGPVHKADAGRFAVHADGKEDRPKA